MFMSFGRCVGPILFRFPQFCFIWQIYADSPYEQTHGILNVCVCVCSFWTDSFSLCILWTPGFRSFLLRGKLTRRKKRRGGHDRASWSGWLMASPHPNASPGIHITPLVRIHLYGNAAASTAGIPQKRCCPLLIVIILADCSSDRPCKTSISHLYGNAPL